MGVINDQNGDILLVNSDGSINATLAGTVPAFSTVATGELAGSATAVQGPSVACREVTFKAQHANAGRVYLGSSTSVTVAAGNTDVTTGLELSAGEAITLPITNLNLIWRICENAGDDLTYIALT